MRDNLFVINAITNATKQNHKEALKVSVYDFFKCFDSLWLSECINDLYDAGLKNDKLVLLYKSNKTANIAIRTSSGTTERFSISDIVMQGTVWGGGLKCTTTMDSLPQQVLQDSQLMYKYRGLVSIPPLEMVDNVITAVECGSKSVKLNAAVSAFIDSKKRSLSTKSAPKFKLVTKVLKKIVQT